MLFDDVGVASVLNAAYVLSNIIVITMFDEYLTLLDKNYCPQLLKTLTFICAMQG